MKRKVQIEVSAEARQQVRNFSRKTGMKRKAAAVALIGAGHEKLTKSK